MPCSICISILKKYAVPHPTTPCPLAKGLYCSLCAKYGHTLKRCTRVLKIPDLADEELTFKKNAINDNMIEFTDLDVIIRAALIANRIVPMTCQEKGKKVQKDFIENKKRLQAFYSARGLTLVLIPPKKPLTDE
jgi:hypothetical protein